MYFLNGSIQMMGCIIGKAGSRINEIRSLSGAQIKIDQGSKEEIGDDETKTQDRLITITGSPEEVCLAQYLINLRYFSASNYQHIKRKL